MSDAPETQEIDAPAAPRVERSAAALVAQYIHELSARHGRAEERPARAERDGLEVLLPEPC